MLQVYVDDLGPILERLQARSWPLYLEPREV